MVAGLFCVLGLLLTWRQPPGNRFRVAFCSLAPLGLIGFLIAWYNDARFGNPFEFGQRYQLAGVEMAKISFFQLDNAPYNIWYYFFAPLYSMTKFPFVDALPSIAWLGHFNGVQKVGGMFQLSGHFYGLEKVTGMFQVSPVTIFALTLPLLYTRHATGSVDKALRVTLILMAGAVLAVVGPLMFVSGATMRYMVDFVPTIVFLACVMLCHFYCLIRKARFKRWIFNGFVAVILFVGCANGLFLSFTGYYNYLQRGDPKAYAAVAEFFQPLEHLAKAVGETFHR